MTAGREPVEVSVVIPCLNEEQAIAACIRKALSSFDRAGLSGEVVVVDNGSTDRSVEVSLAAGARVINEHRKGYGSALRRGIEEAEGEYIIMADGDDTYDFSLAPAFVAKLKEGYDLVMGSRFRGKILPGAMTWSHRYIGNPILSGILRLFFGGTVSDSHCGLRAFTKEAYRAMNLRTTGMEFASEMVIHSLKKKLRITEIPIDYYPRIGESKLSSLRDAWRHMRFMLLYSPRYLFIMPGLVIFVLSFMATIRLTAGPLFAFGREWGVHVMVFSTMFTLLGYQILTLGVAAKTFAHAIELEEDERMRSFLSLLTLERALAAGILLILTGIGVLIYIVAVWYGNHFGELREVNTGLFGLTLIVMGLQTVFTSFLMSMLQIKYR